MEYEITFFSFLLTVEQFVSRAVIGWSKWR